MYHDEVVSGELGQIGTQFDGLGHIGIGNLFYNGNDRADFAKPEGLAKLGVENVGAIATRGVLVDVPALQRRRAARRAATRSRWPTSTSALAREKVEIHAGDVVLFHTGWGSLWIKDNAKFNAARRARASRRRSISSITTSCSWARTRGPWRSSRIRTRIWRSRCTSC